MRRRRDREPVAVFREPRGRVVNLAGSITREHRHLGLEVPLCISEPSSEREQP